MGINFTGQQQLNSVKMITSNTSKQMEVIRIHLLTHLIQKQSGITGWFIFQILVMTVKIQLDHYRPLILTLKCSSYLTFTGK